MNWRCTFVAEPPKSADDGRVDYAKLSVGDMWFLDLPEDKWRDCHLTKYYWQHNTRRPPLVVLLPGPNYFMVDGQCYSSEKGYYDAWTVSGKTPVITVSPSIHIFGRYHGWLKDGVIGNDVDGRRFDAAGIKIK